MTYHSAKEVCPAAAHRKRPRARHSGRRVLGLLLSLLLLPSPSAAEHRLKTAHEIARLELAFLYNFAKFTEWPNQPSNKPLRFCALGTGPVADLLPLLRGRPLHQLPIEIGRAGAGVTDCQLLFLGESLGDDFSLQLAAVRDQPVLTVSRIAGFAAAGGIIELYTEQGHISFTVNLAAARRAGVNISSRLLRLARVIEVQP